MRTRNTSETEQQYLHTAVTAMASIHTGNSME